MAAETSSSSTSPGQKLAPKPAKIITADKTFEIPPNASREQYNHIVKNCLDFIKANKLQNKPLTLQGFEKNGSEAAKQLIKANVPVLGLDDPSNSKISNKELKLLNQAAIEIRKELKGKPISEKDFAKRLQAKFNQLNQPAPTAEVTLLDNQGNSIRERYDPKQRQFREVQGSLNQQSNNSGNKIYTSAGTTISASPTPVTQKKKAAMPAPSNTAPMPKPSWIKQTEELKTQQAQAPVQPRPPSIFDLPTIPKPPKPPGSTVSG
ncbi:MAG TPA: hypothetical protein VHE99_12525 [Gammaproteobacteria bacterium]|nr:hypothetical protein [Gammaproteobacteria bacterium]